MLISLRLACFPHTCKILEDIKTEVIWLSVEELGKYIVNGENDGVVPRLFPCVFWIAAVFHETGFSTVSVICAGVPSPFPIKALVNATFPVPRILG